MKSKLSRRSRKGVECVEVAVSLPLLVIAMFATIEITHRWHVEKLLKLASYEAIKVACARDGSSELADKVFQDRANALGIHDAKLFFNRRQVDKAKVGKLIRFRAVAPARRNQIVSPIGVNFSSTLSGGSVYYRKEGL